MDGSKYFESCHLISTFAVLQVPVWGRDLHSITVPSVLPKAKSVGFLLLFAAIVSN